MREDVNARIRDCCGRVLCGGGVSSHFRLKAKEQAQMNLQFACYGLYKFEPFVIAYHLS